MEKFIKFLFSCVCGTIVVNMLVLSLIGIVPDGDLGAIPIILFFVLSYMFFIACLSVWGYKRMRSIIGVNGIIFILNIITGYMFYGQKMFTVLVYSLVSLCITLVCTLLTKFVLFLNGNNSNTNAQPTKNSIFDYKYRKNNSNKQ